MVDQSREDYENIKPAVLEFVKHVDAENWILVWRKKDGKFDCAIRNYGDLVQILHFCLHKILESGPQSLADFARHAQILSEN